MARLAVCSPPSSELDVQRPTQWSFEMTDAADIAKGYIALWNEPDAERRATLLAANWNSGATYVDPLAAVAGHAEINALIGGVQARFPNFRFNLIRRPEAVGDQVRFSWTLGPGDYVDAPIEGTDFVTVANGKLAAVTGFLDKVPEA
jgi:hypothetical protein